jgi:hypothetical protein
MTWTLRLSNLNGDLSIRSGRFLTITGADEVAQRVRLALHHVTGEYFLNTPAGVPWNTDILGQKYDGARIDAIIRRAILQTPGVLRINRFSSSFENTERFFSVDSEIEVQSGSNTTDTVPVQTTIPVI